LHDTICLDKKNQDGNPYELNILRVAN